MKRKFYCIGIDAVVVMEPRFSYFIVRHITMSGASLLGLDNPPLYSNSDFMTVVDVAFSMVNRVFLFAPLSSKSPSIPGPFTAEFGAQSLFSQAICSVEIAASQKIISVEGMAPAEILRRGMMLSAYDLCNKQPKDGTLAVIPGHTTRFSLETAVPQLMPVVGLTQSLRLLLEAVSLTAAEEVSGGEAMAVYQPADPHPNANHETRCRQRSRRYP